MNAAPTMTTAAPVLELNQVDVASARADEVTVIGQVDWRVLPRDFWVIGSQAGMGKTALLQTAAGIQRPRSGRLAWFGRDTGEMREAELLQARLRMGLIFEGGGRMFAGLTVAENIALPYCYHHNCTMAAVAERLAKVLEYAGLSPWAAQRPNRIPRAISGRIGLARAIITGPEVLLLDNPLHGMDEGERAWWRARIRELAGGGAGILDKPLTVMVATDEVRPWMELGQRFALVRARRFHDLGDRAAVSAGNGGALHDLLALDPAGG